MYFFDLEDYATTDRRIPLHFNCTGFYNGKQSWLSDDSTLRLIWNNTTTPNYWVLSGDSLGSIQVINTNPASPPINGNWTVIGGPYVVSANQGVCPLADELTMDVTKNNPTCTCDGSITVLGSGGVPPYQYSFNNGVTYGNSPFKTNICGDRQLTVMIRDSNGTVKSQLVQIPPQIESVEYDFSLELISSTEISASQPREILNEYAITVNPPLPNGVTVTFNLTSSARYLRSPSLNSATGTITPVVIKNGTTLTYTDNTTTNTYSNPNPGCQSYSAYHTYYEYVYGNLTYTNTDVYVIKMTSYLLGSCQSSPSSNQSLSETDENSLGPLGYAQQASNSYLNCCYYSLDLIQFLGQPSEISNCNCCSLGGYTKSLYE